MEKEKKLKTIDFLSIFCRSFFMQAVWNYKSLLSMGFCFAIIPVAKRLYGTKEEFKEFLKRHLSFFNAHPYFASYALGSIARLEEDYANSDHLTITKIDRFKSALIGPLGALGDQFFWASAKPATVLIAFTGVAVFSNLDIQLLFIIVLLILYNIPHFYIRAAGLWKGYKSGYDTYKLLRIEHFAIVKKFYQILGAAALGLFIGFILAASFPSNIIEKSVFVFSALTAFFVKNKMRAVYLPILIPLVLAALLGILTAKI